MDIHFSPDLEAKLTRLASNAGCDADHFVQKLVANQIEHDEWFRAEVEKGLATLDRGESLSHDEVGQRIERLLQL